MLQELRTIELPIPGPAGGGEKCYGFFFPDYGAGPFHTAKDLEAWFNNRLQLCKKLERVAEGIPAFQVEKLVMAHMDPHCHNIIIDRDGRPWLIDWESAGAFQPYLEKANLLHVRDRGGHPEFQQQLHDAISDEAPTDAQYIALLEEMTFAFTTGAMACRPDLEE
ncbi:hypothetical protein EJ03DRAFT_328725 [Teratosphaeria nubilosa]|uniref:Aminoglycoside phosphotransferase domain-containing protein n=1 Tax=Teratosphaeria nubilosa TaxID=161662 RepID=A0A6G1L552_9PEZI|nr:hypothetical protein EJ03DRAFT_328725 [Teratosphaeria nubilosa]